MTQLDDAYIAKPAPPETYLRVAESTVLDVKFMAEHGITGLTLPLVAAHTLECALKAFLSRDGQDKRLKDSDIRHDLKKLWNLAIAEGLPLGAPPNWVIRLSQIHHKPYHLRYALGIHAISTPASEPMTTDLLAIIETVRQGIHDYRKSLE